MPYGAVLAAVPWGTVIDRAPSVLDSVSQLVGKMRSSPQTLVAPTAADSNTSVADNVARLEEAALTLNRQLTDATELLAATVESNRQLGLIIVSQRKNLLGLAASSALSWIALLYLLVR